MSINYDNLWGLLKERDMLKKDLCASANISHASVAKLAKNENVNTDILERICTALHCDIKDIMRFVEAEPVVPSKQKVNIKTKPLVKWAGGKTQLLTELVPRIPEYTGKYIEPFFGGGALYFAVNPGEAVIADSNPELINVYREVAEHCDEVIDRLSLYENTEEMFYSVREQDWEKLDKAEAAARFIYLNKTCFNGLYRVNKQGKFNVPFGKYKRPNICDVDTIHAASELLNNAIIICGDYLDVLRQYAKPGDFIFLDPPYIPVSDYADFKRYTKEQFYEEDHIRLAKEVKRLYDMGCYVLLTNSNHPKVYELYSQFQIDVIQTKRHISSKGSSRKGEDAIVTAFPSVDKSCIEEQQLKQVALYPPTRFMGSKNKLLQDIWSAASRFEFNTVVDLFSGSGVVGYMFKAHGKQVFSNDYMAMSATFAKAMIENNTTTLDASEVEELLLPAVDNDHFVVKNFSGLYFSNEDNEFIDNVRSNIKMVGDEYKKAIAMSALIRACMKKRPRGIFTYTGERYNDGRRDLKKSFKEQFIENVNVINKAVFDNGKENHSYWMDSLKLNIISPDMVYIDPPYYSPLSDNEYVRRYHFVEGLARDWQGVELQQNTKTKKFKSYPTPFSKRDETVDAFSRLFHRYEKSILIVSYSSNSLPAKDEMVDLLKETKTHVEVIPIDYTYGFGNQSEAKTNRNRVQEYLFVAY